ncbi:MAG: hypothetical protein HGB12_15000 [Bacteroidetes bacterium]|nr:hypothetical protein [Bacteroidota bacterium]
MKNRMFLIAIGLFSIIFISFKNNFTLSSTQVESQKLDGEIIGFDPLKCGCCWGWIIKIGNDTIKADNLPNKEIIAGIIDIPIKVKIELGEKLNRCTHDYHYYEIKYIEIIKK